MSSNYNFKVDYPELEDLYNFSSKSLPNARDVNFVVTHGNCSDGFMSRVVIEKEMRENPDYFTTPLDDVEFVDACYGQDFSDLPQRMKGKTVLMCDFSFKPDLFNKMIKATNGKILVLDHHATAQSNFVGIDPKYAVFDMKHSGAFITQVFVKGFQNVPKAVLYVEDNDIWLKALPNTLEFTAFMFLQPFEYDSYVKLFDDAFVQETVIQIGVGAVLQNQAHIGKILSRTQVSFQEIKDRLYFVANIECAGILQSELGNQAMIKFPKANFAFCYTPNVKYGSTSISLRSMNDRSDVSYIGGLFDGGGHRNASGMGLNNLASHIPGRVIDEYRAYDMLEHVYVRKFADKNYLMLNTSNMKTSFAKYLMQERFVGEHDSKCNEPRSAKNLPGYQEGLFVMRGNSKKADLDEVYDGAVCWHFDGNTNRYFLTIKPVSNHVEAVREFMKKCNRVYNVFIQNDEELPPFDSKERKDIFYCEFSSNISFANPEELLETLNGPL